MKLFLRLAALGLLAALGIWLIYSRPWKAAEAKTAVAGPPATAVPVNSPPVLERPAFPGPSELARIERERSSFVAELAADAKEGNSRQVATALQKILSQFQGDPSSIFRECSFLLKNPNPEIRLSAAWAFMKSGFQPDEAAQALLGILNGGTGKSGVLQNLRRGAAIALSEYRISEAAEGIWNLYSETTDDTLLFGLGRLGDPRALQPVEELVKGSPPALAQFAEILGELKAADFLSSLQQNVNFLDQHKSAPDFSRFQEEKALYQMTGDESHLDYLIKNAATENWILYLVDIQSPKVEVLLKSLLSSDRALVADAAFVGLHTTYPGGEEVRDIVVELLEGRKISPNLNMQNVIRVGVNLNDPEIDKLGVAWDAQTQEGRWAFWANRKTWPLANEWMH